MFCAPVHMYMHYVSQVLYCAMFTFCQFDFFSYFVMKLIMSVPNDAFIYTSVYRFGSLYRNRKFNFHVSDKVDDFIDDNNVTFLNCRKTKCCLVK